MLYRVQPMGQITWNGDVTGQLLEVILKENAELDRLEWKPLQEQVSFDGVLQVALRHGVKTESGIAVESRHVSAITRPAELRSLYSKELHRKRPELPKAVQEQIPGDMEDRDRTDAQVRETIENKIREADADAKAELKSPVKHDLLDWWNQLGGIVS